MPFGVAATQIEATEQKQSTTVETKRNLRLLKSRALLLFLSSGGKYLPGRTTQAALRPFVRFDHDGRTSYC
jgi:hypothetical protein